MTTRFAIRSLAIETVSGPVTYDFPSSLTVLAGDVGVGKSTLFELIKFGLGCDALLADVVESSVTGVRIRVNVGHRDLIMARSTSPGGRDRVSIVDAQAGVALPDHFTTDTEPSVSDLLLSSLELPLGMRASARTGKSSKQGSRITFTDIFRYLYIPQSEINQEIAGSNDSYYDPKRRAVFELLFGLTNADVLRVRTDVTKARAKYDEARREADLVAKFLKESKTASRSEAEIALQAAENERVSAESRLVNIRSSLEPIMDEETQTLRDLLSEAERELTTTKRQFAAASQQRLDFAREAADLRQDIARAEKQRVAGARLATIEFVICPRCMQSIKHRSADSNECRLCLQPEPAQVEDESGVLLGTLHQELEEALSQVAHLDSSVPTLAAAIDGREALVARLTTAIESRTSARITPQLQAFADASAKLAKANAQRESTERILIQLDRFDDLRLLETEAHQGLRLLEVELKELTDNLKSKHLEVMAELNQEFAATVERVRIPGVNSAEIDPKTFLPKLNGKPARKVSPAGGGIRTATQVAYWVSLLTVALRRGDSFYPSFLLIDSPRTSLNDSDDLSSALYRQLVTLADSAGSKIQIIIGDNELPAAYRKHYAQFDFDYNHPTIGSVHHPGRDAVETIN